MTVDAAGNLYISDTNNGCIRKVDLVVGDAGYGNIATVAGQPTHGGYSGDGGPATAAMLKNPNGVALDAAGNLYISDWQNNRVSRSEPGQRHHHHPGRHGRPAFNGDGQPGTLTSISNPNCVACDTAGNVYIADNANNRLRKIGQNASVSVYAAAGSQSTTTTLAVSNATPVYGQALDLHGGGELPRATVWTGSVAFEEGTTVLATVPVNRGVASFTTTTLPAGSNALTAVYSGGSSGFGGSSGSASVTVSKARLCCRRLRRRRKTTARRTAAGLCGTIIGLQNGDAISAAYTCSGLAATTAPGNYTIGVTLNDPNGAGANYVETLQAGTLTVSTETLYATSYASMTYAAVPALTPAYLGLVNGDTVSGIVRTAARRWPPRPPRPAASAIIPLR